ncbi:5'/3'-nucleotidase SurE [Pseudohoeflea coraliihabitans]|uniref:5'-nucleotidase SurE n=1 Tax=Pseudohoeflea coraliihabitans TaxID=2860393 RepID=A0ABS6WQ98_9HYPH|nr:5'/3'-nucleotidase SurE [Pseudohoeflea sp. DP4N28-3]MBW3098126.1 5'/3'-nucleotidase SurE [Pseudohoeflea sp. DP4N28-3]
MRILLTNDDGIHAPGLAVLEKIARKLSDDVWIVAPETDQSGLAHSLTLSEPLRLRKVADQHYALRGTPTDCVIMAVRNLMDSPPDIVLSGVNTGLNAGDDVTYSGTVAGAMEGTLLGIRSFALSQHYNWESEGRVVPWEVAEEHGPDLLEKLIDADIPKGRLININFPNCAPDKVKGIKVTQQGQLTHALQIVEREDGRGLPYYWLKFGRRGIPDAGETDLSALYNDCISVTPLKLDLTDHDLKDTLAKAIDED